MTRKERHDRARRILRLLGWDEQHLDKRKNFRRALKNFKAGYALSDKPLRVNRFLSKRTMAALEHSNDRRLMKRGTASHHFSFHEMQCKCILHYGHRLPGCEAIKVTRELLLGLEAIRHHFFPSGFEPVSGYRCPRYNTSIHGATDSQHLYGRACDPPAQIPYGQILSLHKFSGIGIVHATGKVAHVDVRPASSGGTPSRPIIWYYY